VRLLFDENLSPRLVAALNGAFPGSAHVDDVGLRGFPDNKIWEYARENGFTIVSKDTDFRERSAVYGTPPKVMSLAIGNAGTSAVIDLLLRARGLLLDFESDNEATAFILSGEARGNR